MFKSIDKKKIYDNSQLAFVFEFFTPLNKREASAKFARALGKKIKWFKEVLPTFEATGDTFKIAPTYSNGFKEITLTTGFLPYQEAVHMFLKTMNIIDTIGYTNERCTVHTKIKLNESELGLANSLSKINKFKYLLGINEKELFEMWPAQENENRKLYQNHLQFIQPREIYNTVITENLIERMNPVEFVFPESDFFANDFSKIEEGFLTIRYIGGKDYTKKKKQSIATINLVIEHLFSTLSNNYEYSVEEKKKISNIVDDFRKSIDSTRNYLNFKSLYPEISMYVDLKSDYRLIEANYSILREKIFKLIVGGGITEGIINYDTRRKVLQIKDAKINKSILIEGIEFYQCEVQADSKKCLFEGCTITDSKMVECTIFSNNIVRRSKLIECDYLGGANEISSSYLENSDNKMINANVSECLIKKGKFTINSTVDKSTRVLGRK